MSGRRWSEISVLRERYKEQLLKSLGWVEGDITLEISELYIVKKGSKNTNVQMMKKMQMEAKVRSQKEKYKKRIEKWWKSLSCNDGNERVREPIERKLAEYKEKYPDIYREKVDEIEEKARAKKALENEKKEAIEAQQSLF